MPTYVYRREDGTTFEIEQRITEDALAACPTTGQPVRRLISGNAGLIFKGGGFYLTDYTGYGKESGGGKSDAAEKSEGKADAPAASDAKSEAKGESKSAAKAESKPESKSESKSESKPSSPPSNSKNE